MSHRAFALASLVALALVACGADSTGGNTGAPTGAANATATPQVAPQDAVLTAVHHASATSFRADISLTLSFTTPPTDTGNIAALNGRSMTMHMQLNAESPQRNRVDVTADGLNQHVVAVLYDGRLYMSLDGGKTFKTVSLSSVASGSYGEDTALSYLEDMATVTDQGAAEVNGVSVEDYHAELDPAKLTAAVRAALSNSGAGALVDKVLSSLKLTDGHVDAFVDSAGHIVSENGTIDATMSLGAINASLAGQSVILNEGFTGDFHDFGAAITVTPPHA